jgi:MFS family permease
MTYSFMVGTGETYFAAFAVALGSSDRTAGLVAAVPPLVGATLQLFAPVLAARVKSPSRWIQTCALLQVASFVPMIVGALVGALPMWVLFIVAGVYWTAALGAGGVWNTWVGLCFPPAIRALLRYSQQALPSNASCCTHHRGRHSASDAWNCVGACRLCGALHARGRRARGEHPLPSQTARP